MTTPPRSWNPACPRSVLLEARLRIIDRVNVFRQLMDRPGAPEDALQDWQCQINGLGLARQTVGAMLDEVPGLPVPEAPEDQLCPDCLGVPVAPEVEGCRGCSQCDYTGTLAGHQRTMEYCASIDKYYHQREAELFHLALNVKPWDLLRAEGMPWYQHLFYVFKTWWCMKAGWTRVQERHGSYPSTVDVALLEASSCGYGWDSETLTVGYGYFERWFYDIQSDGDSTY
jgi:hypothetical protein